MPTLRQASYRHFWHFFRFFFDTSHLPSCLQTYTLPTVCETRTLIKKYNGFGGRPGLVVMGDNSYLRGCGFESRRRILDGHFFTMICCKNCIVCLKIPKINEKEARVGPFKKIIMGMPQLADRSLPTPKYL